MLDGGAPRPRLSVRPEIVMRSLALFLGTCALAAVAAAQPDPSGIEFVTVGDPGNPAWTGGGFNNGRGAVDYEFRIGKYEVTTAQWAEFMNAALDRPSTDRIPHVFAPTQWGAVGTTPQNAGGQRFTVPAGREMIPTGGVDWRTSAIFCNWLHNGKGTSRESFLSGAYDVSTFGYFMGGSTFTDQPHAQSGGAVLHPVTGRVDEGQPLVAGSQRAGAGGVVPLLQQQRQPVPVRPAGGAHQRAARYGERELERLFIPGAQPLQRFVGRVHRSDKPVGVDGRGWRDERVDGRLLPAPW